MTDDHDRCEWVNVSSGTGHRRRSREPPKFERKNIFSGKHHVIFGQLIYFFGRRKNRHPLFFDSILFFISCVQGI